MPQSLPPPNFFDINKETVKNRLVLIGNGFDLALGNKTSYNDFLLWFLKKQILTAVMSGGFRSDNRVLNGFSKHQLVNIKIPTKYSNVDYEKELASLETYTDIREFCKRRNIEIEPNSIFFERILRHSKDIGWVNIEDIYYTLLKECLKSKTIKVEDLNENLKVLSLELEIYLDGINTLENDWTGMARSIIDQVIKPFQRDEFIDGDLNIEDQNPEIVYFLNFNYTTTLEKITQYPQQTHNSKLLINQIHGKINDQNNPIIFGFGDEYDDAYKEIEKMKDNQFFEHIKSFKYLNTPNYHNLLRFLEADNFQVFIYGHSCGLSDKTMLKQIFEHENCKSIKIFYYKNQTGWDDFEEKTMEISRHFDNKGLMRKLIVNREFSEAIPQQEGLQGN